MTWRVAKSLIQLRQQIDIKAPKRSKANDGTIGDAAHAASTSDHNPWVKEGPIGIVTAIDITHDPVDGCDAQQIVMALIASKDVRIKYIIWNKQIISSAVKPWVWRPYNGKNPHSHHFHLSIQSEKNLYDSVEIWHL